MSEPGAAVEEQNLDARIVAGALGPHVEGALRCVDGNHLHAAAEHVVATGGLVVALGILLGFGFPCAAVEEQRGDGKDQDGFHGATVAERCPVLNKFNAPFERSRCCRAIASSLTPEIDESTFVLLRRTRTRTARRSSITTES